MENTYLASFFTELGAVEFLECLQALGDTQAHSLPVPRQVSVSCGTGVSFTMEFDEERMNNPDLDSIFRVENGEYVKLWSQDD